MKIAIASDHAGYNLKEELTNYLKSRYEVLNLGTDNELDSVDYPDFAKKVADEVNSNNVDFGIVICGTGIGISIAANKIDGIRAALVYDENTAQLAKKHNNANIIALGGRTTTISDGKKIVDAYIRETFEQRHQKRIDKISKLEKKGDK